MWQTPVALISIEVYANVHICQHALTVLVALQRDVCVSVLLCLCVSLCVCVCVSVSVSARHETQAPCTTAYSHLMDECDCIYT